MADAMLVFACGLILALIISWNVNLDEFGTITSTDQKKYEIDGMDSANTQQIDADNQLEEMGTVYRDLQTGRYYVIEE